MLTLSLKSHSTLPLELSEIIPEIVREKSLAEVAKLKMWHGRVQVALAELFSISGSATDQQLEFSGDLSTAVGIGANMKSGKIRVHGNAGREVGLGMSGGEIEVTGNVGDSPGAEMHGGIIRVQGSAGNFVGGARVGSTRGMTGGTILVLGNARNGIGSRMRRGLIAVAGNAGELVGHNMLAGTIVINCACGRHAGAGMKRGTLCLVHDSDAQLLPTFRYACRTNSPMLGMLGRQLQSLGFENQLGETNRQWQQFNGDFLASGRGELFVASGR
ncbi:MAG: formylmethanofuran dehydrogenase subunit C [Bythopirellula sp.]|nr:formylmethanofuran dehydrogenase subunit C [Bythopirellula sp.]